MKLLIPEESEHLLFKELYTTGKTQKVQVMEKKWGTTIGTIKWEWKWKQYCLFINTGAQDYVMDHAMLLEIAAILAGLMHFKNKEKKNEA